MAIVSIIICTKNRAESLRETLASIGRCDLSAGLTVEVIVVDNGSTDGTAGVVRGWRPGGMEVVYLWEPNGGKSAGLNLAIRHARGEVLVFTDDDVRPAGDWIVKICGPILEGRADATVGTIRIAAHLRRSWLEQSELGCLACREVEREASVDLVGANMAVGRGVFRSVPGFDVELGPGPAAGGEDTLFSWQLREAGFRIVGVPEAVVEHHFDVGRLSRESMERVARKGAVSDFYIGYHWMHRDLRFARYRYWRAVGRLFFYRIRRWSEWRRHEGMPGWERGMIQEVETCRLHLEHGGEPRKYRKGGLVKLSSGAERESVGSEGQLVQGIV